ncbi:hypothetical protein V502_08496 [Pseudogymnoascus sp. VKM F-4520 (FW-2644)]|nr:hypothetical protein V502_08496 [Pseudogymnoascus sp. VKM F-4520 (FW-2644)]
MASQLPPVLHSDPKPSLEKASPLTPTEQLALQKHEMALERAEIQHQQDVTLLKISLLRLQIQTTNHATLYAMSPHPSSASRSPWPTSHTSSARSTSSSSIRSTTLITPGDTSPTPDDEATHISLHHRKMTLDEATQEFARENTKLEQDWASLERDCADLKSRKAELEQKTEEIWHEMARLDAAEKEAETAIKERRAFLETKQKEAAELLRKRNLMNLRVAAEKVAVDLLIVVPGVSLGITVLAMELALGWRMLTWGVAVVSR